jgi:outer membrane protein OmpA-like peptidoglycan-associated protein
MHKVVPLVLVTLTASIAHAGWTYYVSPPIYEQNGVTIVSKEIKLGPTDGKLWVNVVVANHTGKELTIDLNQIFMLRLDGSTSARTTGVFGGPGKPVVIASGLSAPVRIEFVLSKKPEPVELLLNKAFIVNGKSLRLPNYPIDPVGNAKFIAMKKDHIELKQKVHFATDKSKIMGDSYEMLNEVALAMRMRPTMRVRIEGHTDERGSGDHNDRLSQSRADAVKAFLVQKKVGAERMQAQGFGSQKPVAQGDSDVAHEQNRRVEFVITEQ